MSLANLSVAYEAARFRAQPPGHQQRELEELLAQWFLDSNEGAREFLREIAQEYREAHPVSALESAPQQMLEESYGKGDDHDADEMRSDVADVVERRAGGSDHPAPDAAAGVAEAAVGEGVKAEVSQDGGLRVGYGAGAQK